MSWSEDVQKMMNEYDLDYTDGRQDFGRYIQQHRVLIKALATAADRFEIEIHRLSGLVEYQAELNHKLTEEIEAIIKTKW
jgi:hypothetical protein